MRFAARLLLFFSLLGLGASAAVALLFYGAFLSVEPNLPDTEQLRRVELQVPMRVYTADGLLIGEFGEQRRDPVRFDELPEPMVQAFVSAEDDRFFEHPGVDWQGLARAVLVRIASGQRRQGGSTITMQVARNFFLTRKKSYLRKINEIFLSFQIEKDLRKEEILALYLNKIYLGQRAYGVRAAARIYYDKKLSELSLAETAMIAALPKAPSTTNPISNPERAKTRRNYVLRRMHELGYIDTAAFEAAKASEDHAQHHLARLDLDAPYIAEMVRASIVEQYGSKAYTSGFRIFTTIDSSLQKAAINALRSALLAYDRRHGYRGPESRLAEGEEFDREARMKALSEVATRGDLFAALVVELDGKETKAVLADQSEIVIGWKALSWAREFLSDYRRGPAPKKAGDVLKVGDIILVERLEQPSKATPKEGEPPPTPEVKWRLAKTPLVQGAIAALHPEDSAILALTGGFDFNESKFNRATQAQRQAGSGIKPFIYLSGLIKGLTPATLINDAPVVFNDSSLEGDWRPENYSGKFFGPTRLREALTRSRNLVSIRLLQKVGINYAADFLARLGFPEERITRDLSLSLGTLSLTPLEVASRYALLANGGFKTEPWLIQRIEDPYGKLVYEHTPLRACATCTRPSLPQAEAVVEAAGQPGPLPVSDSLDPTLAERVIPRQDHYLIYSMMQDVIKRGTARRALALKRNDLAGKTGTTNDQQDAWFSGFNRDVVASAWVGFDQIKPLGARETGGRAALPMWIDFMKVALADKPENAFSAPPGIVRVKIDPTTGEATSSSDPNGISEVFRSDTAPKFIRRLPAIPLSNELPGGSLNGTTEESLPDTERLF